MPGGTIKKRAARKGSTFRTTCGRIPNCAVATAPIAPTAAIAAVAIAPATATVATAARSTTAAGGIAALGFFDIPAFENRLSAQTDAARAINIDNHDHNLVTDADLFIDALYVVIGQL